jgi:aspartyl-tRNA(Asn)/glutamyl-tRNA(Gln) amidotransferase subunit C
MSAITAHTVHRIAALARVALTKAEAREVAEKLNGILSHFAAIQTIDTSAVAPAEDVTGFTNVTRPDEPAAEQLCSHEALLKTAPATEDGHIKVRSVF